MAVKKIALSATIVSMITMLSRVLGYVRDAISAALFGVGVVSDAFFVAFRIPNLLRNLMAEGALASAFIPAFTEYIEKKPKKTVWNLAANALTLLTIVMVFITALGVIFAPIIVKIIAPGFSSDPEKFRLTVELTRYLFPFILFMSISALFMGILNSLKQFSIPAFAPVILNISMITAGIFICPLFGLSPEKQVYGWVIGALAGAFLQIVLQYIPAARSGFILKPLIDLKDSGLRKMGRLMVPATFAQSVTQLNLLINTILASLLVQGSVTYLYYGNRLMQLPLGVFGVAIATVSFPYIAQYAARKDTKNLRDTIHSSLKQAFFIVIPASAGIIFLSEPINTLLFYYGRFSHADAINTARVCVMYSLAIFAYTGVKILTQVYYAIDSASTAVKISIASLVVNLALCLILMKPMQYLGLALATAIAGVFHFILLYVFIEKKVGDIKTKQLVVFSAKLVIISLVMGAAVFFASGYMTGIWNVKFNRITNAIIVLISISLGMMVYFGLVKLAGIREGDRFFELLRIKRRG